MKALLALTVANIKSYVRDRAALFWTLAFPLIFIFMFGFIFQGGGGGGLTLAWVDDDASPESAQLRAAFAASESIELVETTEADALSRMQDGEVDAVRRLALDQGAHAAEVNEAFERGGAGAAALAEAVVDATSAPPSFDHTYPIDAPIEEKIEAVAKRVYGADGIFLLKTARDKIERFTAEGLDRVPICMAKTHLSLSHDAALLNAPTGFTVTVRDIRAYTGAGWLVPLCGDMQTMPGLAERAAGFDVDIDEHGRTVGLF